MNWDKQCYFRHYKTSIFPLWIIVISFIRLIRTWKMLRIATITNSDSSYILLGCPRVIFTWISLEPSAIHLVQTISAPKVYSFVTKVYLLAVHKYSVVTEYFSMKPRVFPKLGNFAPDAICWSSDEQTQTLGTAPSIFFRIFLTIFCPELLQKLGYMSL